MLSHLNSVASTDAILLFLFVILFPRPEHQGLNVCNVLNGLLPFLRSPQPQGVWSWSMFAKLHCVGVSVNKPTNFRRTAQKEKTKEGQ